MVVLVTVAVQARRFAQVRTCRPPPVSTMQFVALVVRQSAVAVPNKLHIDLTRHQALTLGEAVTQPAR